MHNLRADDPCEMLQWVLAHPLMRDPNKLSKDLPQNSGISYIWLWTLATGKTKHPSVNRVSYLCQYLQAQDFLEKPKEEKIEE